LPGRRKSAPTKLNEKFLKGGDILREKAGQKKKLVYCKRGTPQVDKKRRGNAERSLLTKGGA